MKRPDKMTLLAIKEMVESDPRMTRDQFLKLLDKILAICELDDEKYDSVTKSLIELVRK